MGLVIVLLTATIHGYDVLADPFGWLLVLVGLAGLPVRQQDTLRTLAVLRLLVSVVVWFPGARDALNVTDDSLAWAASIPRSSTVIVLAQALAQAAGSAGDADARRWLQTARTLFVVVLVLPPVVLGGGLDSLVTPRRCRREPEPAAGDRPALPVRRAALGPARPGSGAAGACELTGIQRPPFGRPMAPVFMPVGWRLRRRGLQSTSHAAVVGRSKPASAVGAARPA